MSNYVCRRALKCIPIELLVSSLVFSMVRVLAGA